MISGITKGSCEAERLPEIVPTVPTTKEITSYAAWYISLICSSRPFCLSLTSASAWRSSYPKLYQCLSGSIHSRHCARCDIRAISLQELVSQDGRIPNELHLLVLGYWLWWMLVALPCALRSIVTAYIPMYSESYFSIGSFVLFCTNWMLSLAMCCKLSVAFPYSLHKGFFTQLFLSIAYLFFVASKMNQRHGLW